MANTITVDGETYDFTSMAGGPKWNVNQILERIKRHQSGEEITGLIKITPAVQDLLGTGTPSATESESSPILTAGLLGILGFVIFKPR